MPRNILLLFILLLAGMPLLMPAQEVIAAGGDHHETAAGAISWTLGEPVIETFQAGAFGLTQGLHQTNLVVTAVEEVAGAGLKMTAYPNPTREAVLLSMAGTLPAGLEARLFDTAGRPLARQRLADTETAVDLRRYPAGIYRLVVFSRHRPVRTFQIVKP